MINIQQVCHRRNSHSYSFMRIFFGTGWGIFSCLAVENGGIIEVKEEAYIHPITSVVIVELSCWQADCISL